MALRCGIVGLPNVGKSTLFNALSGAKAYAANFPFCTIEPNRGVVPVPDTRLHRLAAATAAPRAVCATVEFVDIAGLVEGASRGEGLGNAFLGHLRQVDAIVHVVRCFDKDSITHVAGHVDPVRDMQIVQTELLLKDLETAERCAEKMAGQAKGGDKEARMQQKFCERLAAHLGRGDPAQQFRTAGAKEQAWMDQLCLLSRRPVLYVANVSESQLPHGGVHAQAVKAQADREQAECMVLSAAFEAELVELEPDERAEFLQAAYLAQSSLERLVQRTYTLLGLITFFTHGPKETRAWTVSEGTVAVKAAGKIHSDFERGFIRAETTDIETFLSLGSEAAVRAAGAMRSEGKEYPVRDGDVILFRFNV